jgi:hypothetical protein
MNNTQNAKVGFVNYCLWLKWYPGDIKGATEFAGLQLDTTRDVDDITEMIKQFTSGERQAGQTDEFVNLDDGVKTIIVSVDRGWMVRMQDIDSGEFLPSSRIYQPDCKAEALDYARKAVAV